MKSSVSPSLRALLEGIVDYAGLFPPAGLALEQALENHAAYMRGEDAWMLGRFVLPTGKMGEASPLLAGRFDSAHPLRVSALGSKPSSVAGFLDNLRASLSELTRFAQEHGEAVVVNQFEAPLPPVDADGVPSLLRQAKELIDRTIPWPLQTFWEVPFGEGLPATLRGFDGHIAEVVRARGGLFFGIKLRTGGLEAAAFPTPGQLADAPLAAGAAGAALKFTAGLHHPIRRFGAHLGTHTHGFLNAFAAGALANEHRLHSEETRAILEDERPENFRFDAEGFTWCDRRVPTDALAAHRLFVTSFGSCSFNEPRGDLRRLGMLA